MWKFRTKSASALLRTCVNKLYHKSQPGGGGSVSPVIVSPLPLQHHDELGRLPRVPPVTPFFPVPRQPVPHHPKHHGDHGYRAPSDLVDGRDNGRNLERRSEGSSTVLLHAFDLWYILWRRYEEWEIRKKAGTRSGGGGG